jgi:hypothetical protein
MRERRVASRDGSNRTRRDPCVEKLSQQLRDRGPLQLAVGEQLRDDHAQPLVEHVGEFAIDAVPLPVSRVKEETIGQKAVLRRKKTIDRLRSPPSRFGRRGAGLRGRAKDGSAARSQALEGVQFATSPG